MKLPVTSCRLEVSRRNSREGFTSTFNLQLSTFNAIRAAFSLVEVLVAVTLLALIVLALMAVFNTTQKAFRASVSQTDVLEGGRAAMDLMSSDLRQLTPSGGYSNDVVNFFALDNNYIFPNSILLPYTPLSQTLPGGSVTRTDYLQYFFLLGRENTKWIGIGYAVNSTNAVPLYPLYRFYQETNSSVSPSVLFRNFINALNTAQWTNMSHILDGVVGLSVQPSDASGYTITNLYQLNFGQWSTNKNVEFFTQNDRGVVGFVFYSNSVPASIELRLNVLEDRPRQHAESLPFQSAAQTNYLAQQAGRVHVFRQRVPIPNVDPVVYQ